MGGVHTVDKVVKATPAEMEHIIRSLNQENTSEPLAKPTKSTNTACEALMTSVRLTVINSIATLVSLN